MDYFSHGESFHPERKLGHTELLEGIERHALEITRHFRDSDEAYDSYRSFNFTPDTLSNAYMPNFIQEHVNAGYELESAEVDVTSSLEATVPVSITATFYLAKMRGDNRESRVITSIASPEKPEIPDTIGIYDTTKEDAVVYRKEVSNADIYAFIASLIAQTDEQFGIQYLRKPEDFIPYIHSTFALTDISAMLDRAAASRLSETHIRLDAPSSVLPTDLIYHYTEDDVLTAEIELWVDHERSDSISVHLSNDEQQMIWFTYNSRRYEPNDLDIEEFNSRLEHIAQFIQASSDRSTGDVSFNESRPPRDFDS